MTAYAIEILRKDGKPYKERVFLGPWRTFPGQSVETTKIYLHAMMCLLRRSAQRQLAMMPEGVRARIVTVTIGGAA